MSLFDLENCCFINKSHGPSNRVSLLDERMQKPNTIEQADFERTSETSHARAPSKNSRISKSSSRPAVSDSKKVTEISKKKKNQKDSVLSDSLDSSVATTTEEEDSDSEANDSEEDDSGEESEDVTPKQKSFSTPSQQTGSHSRKESSIKSVHLGKYIVGHQLSVKFKELQVCLSK